MTETLIPFDLDTAVQHPERVRTPFNVNARFEWIVRLPDGGFAGKVRGGFPNAWSRERFESFRLVAPPPVRAKAWANIYPDRGTVAHSSREEANLYRHPKGRLAFMLEVFPGEEEYPK